MQTLPIQCQLLLPVLRLLSITLSTCWVKAWKQVRPYVIVVFKGGNGMLLGLLQELYSRYALSHIPIFTVDEVRQLL